VLHLVEAQAANLTQRRVCQAEVVEVEEGSNNVFECMVVFLLLTLIFIGKSDTYYVRSLMYVSTVCIYGCMYFGMYNTSVQFLFIEHYASKIQFKYM
jgi:hypothetical protein